MLTCLRSSRVRPMLGCLSVALGTALALVLAGCGSGKQAARPPVSRYEKLPAKKLPAFLQGTVMERADLVNSEPFVVSGFGLVVRLRGTGNGNAPTAVRDYMIREMVRHGFNTHRIPGYEHVQPEQMLQDPSVAIVRVEGRIPPGARAGQTFDVQVSALEQSYTKSLAHGQLYATDLRVNGADEIKPGGNVNVLARAQGPVFVNPAYALSTTPGRGQERNSLRYGVILDGGLADYDMPLVLRLRDPQYSVARALENRLDERFQAVADKPKRSGRAQMGVAAALDEGRVYLYVPAAYRGDWERFTEVVKHVYLNNSPDFAVIKARQLAEEAVKPDAPLHDISYAWEALGPEALPAVLPLMAHASPDVAYAAARAAACIGDPAASAEAALLQMARTPAHPFRVNAVQTLGLLPASSRINSMLRQLLASDQTLVRLEAYRILARNGDPAILSRVIQDKFVLDMVPSDGPPLVYASRQGMPRIAIVGHDVAMVRPVMFGAVNNRLSITSNPGGSGVTIYWRPGPEQGAGSSEPVVVQSSADLGVIVARLGGDGADAGKPKLDFSYSDIVALVQAMAQQQKLLAARMDATASGEGATAAADEHPPVPFVLQQLPETQDSIYNAPPIPEPARPQEGPSAAITDPAVPAAVATPASGQPDVGSSRRTLPDLQPSGEDSGKNTAAEAPSSAAQ